MKYNEIKEILGNEAENLLDHQCKTISRELLHLPGDDFVERIFSISDRSSQVRQNLKATFNHGRLKGTGYLSILPVDQGMEHSAGASFAPNPIYFDPENIVRLAVDGGCNAVTSTLGVLGMVAADYMATSTLSYFEALTFAAAGALLVRILILKRKA